MRAGAERAVLRVDVVHEERHQLIEAELRATGRNRVLLNRNPLSRTRELLGCVRVTVFAPDDLQLVKAGPAARRAHLDELLVAIAPRYEAARADYERVLRHRNALLRGGVRGNDARATLDVFDEQLVTAAGELVRGRVRLVERLAPAVDAAYRELAPGAAGIDAVYQAAWASGDGSEEDAGPPEPDEVDDLLRAALVRTRRRELERGTTLVGPHRDEWRLSVGGLDSRTHASQGEQRTLALALRLAGHRVVAERVDAEPVLLLDDVFSELDESRSRALVERLPDTQTLLTTAGVVPVGIEPSSRLRIAGGRVEVA